jgi:hypothetical protein
MLGASIAYGWSGVFLAYAAVQGPMVAGLVHGRAQWQQYLLSPLIAAPLAALVGGASAVAGPFLSVLGAVPAGLVEFTLGTSLSVALGYSGGRVLAEDAPRSDGAHQRGARVSERASSSPPRQRNRSSAITLAGRPVPFQDETKHFKLIGTTGTGKSTAIQELLSTALARGDRAIIADPDGGYMRRFFDPARGDTVLNPFDERSVKWDLFGEIKTRYDVDQLARSLIPDQEGADRSWRGYARTFFAAVARQSHEAGVTDLSELYRLLVVAETGELRTLLRGSAAQPFLDEHNSRMFDSIRSVTTSAVGALDYIAQQPGAGAGRDFSVRAWVAEQRQGVLFMPYKAGQIAALGSTISAWMRLAIFEAMDQGEQSSDRRSDAARPIWFIVDELDALGQIDGLKDALARLRKFGGRCVLGFQSVAQVSSTYGHGDAHTIVENCGNSLILRCSASEGGGTARFASQLIGEREVLRTSTSRSRRVSEMLGSISHNEHLSVEAAVMPSQIEQLPDLQGYLKLASEPEWRRVQLRPPHAAEQRPPERASASRSENPDIGKPRERGSRGAGGWREGGGRE